MILIFAVLGFILGASFDGEEFGVVLAGVGAVLGLVLAERRKRKELEQRVLVLEALQRGASPAPTAQDVSPAPTAAPTPQDVSHAPVIALAVAAAPETAPASAPQDAAPVAAPITPAADPSPAPPEPAAEHPAPTAAPGLASEADAVTKWLRDWFTQGNMLVRVGVVVLLFGVGFLVKYTAELGLVPIEARLTGAAMLGVALVGLGLRVRGKRRAYAMALQGGGIGVTYIVVFAAYRLYELLPATPAFAIMAGLAVFSAIIAILEDAAALAVLGTLGGFLAPILASSGSGNHVALFSYYALLNAGVLATAWFKAWRALNLVGFYATFVVGALWGVNAYVPQHYASAQGFLLLFFVFYVAVAVLYAARRGAAIGGFVDGSLVFALPIIAFGLQVGLVRELEYGLAWSALFLGTFYLGLAVLLWRHRGERLRTITEAFLALGVGFATLTIPFALDGRWTGAAWAIEGAGLAWVGARQRRMLPRAAGALLVLGAAVSHAAAGYWDAHGPPVVNAFHLGAIMIAASAFVIARLETSKFFVVVGWLFWVIPTGFEIGERMNGREGTSTLLGFTAASGLAFELVGARTAFPLLRYAALTMLPAGWFIAFMQLFTSDHHFESYGWAGWTCWLAASYLVLRRQTREGSSHELPLRARAVRWAHAGIHWLVATIAALELGHAAMVLLLLPAVAFHTVDSLVTWGSVGQVLGAVFVFALPLWPGLRSRWPYADERADYLGWTSRVLAAALVVAGLWGNVASSADATPLPYVPIANPLDVSQAAGLLALIAWHLRARRAYAGLSLRRADRAMSIVSGLLAFEWVSATAARSVHHFADVPWDFDALWRSVELQTTWSITWAVVGLALMFFATRRHLRGVWFTGGALLALVVVKLFTIDLSQIGTLARIISFLVVGGLLLLVGWAAPMPPKVEEARSPS